MHQNNILALYFRIVFINVFAKVAFYNQISRFLVKIYLATLKTSEKFRKEIKEKEGEEKSPSNLLRTRPSYHEL